MKNKTVFLLLCAVASVHCGPARQAAAEAARAEAVIRRNIAAFSRDLAAGNFEAVVQAYTADAKIFPPGLDILQRHEAIRNYWTPPADRESRTVDHKVIPQEIVVNGEYAYDWGYYEGRTRQGDGTEQAWRGKYVIVWKQTAPGEWKIYLDCWNRVQ